MCCHKMGISSAAHYSVHSLLSTQMENSLYVAVEDKEQCCDGFIGKTVKDAVTQEA